MKFIEDFKKFAFKGNVIDMAVGVIIGSTFSAIVTSMVNDILMPIIGKLTSGINFSDIKIVLAEAVVDASGNVTTPENAIKIGSFIQAIIYFLLVALVLFLFIRGVNSARDKLKKKEEEAPAVEEEPTPSQEELLLTEIRDLLKNGALPAENSAEAAAEQKDAEEK